MRRIFVPAKRSEAWKALLAEPDLQWKPGRSAMSLAASWESAHPGLPPEVSAPLSAAFGEVELVAAFPEWQVPLPGGRRPSQTDLLVVVGSRTGLVVVAVEGKVDETFGPTVGEKRHDASSGQTYRLAYLQQRLEVAVLPETLRYQLCHRTVSALDTARQFHAIAAVMLVQSFSATSAGFDDFVAFAAHVGVTAGKETLVRVTRHQGPDLYLGWAAGDAAFRHADLR